MKNVIDMTPYLTPVYIRPARRKRRFGSIAAFVESAVTLLVGAMSVLVLLALLFALSRAISCCGDTAGRGP